PNLNVFRPADTVETAEAWHAALESPETPSVIALSRQGLPTVRTTHSAQNLTARGGYILAESEESRKVVLMATGSEVQIAMDARAQLEARGIGCRIVSVPCQELFAQQEERYINRVLPRSTVRIAIEAGVRQSWDQWLLGHRGMGKKAGFVGMEGFGASGPIGDLYPHFGITAEAVVAQAEALL
ncbi:MAG: transketolase C-terminal domain-containing protein, partial [Pseudomonadota bacterium]